MDPLNPEDRAHALSLQKEQFFRDRTEALKSLDYQKILAYCIKYRIDEMLKSKMEVFWASVHRARLTLPEFTEDEKRRSRFWLITNGFQCRGILTP